MSLRRPSAATIVVALAILAIPGSGTLLAQSPTDVTAAAPAPPFEPGDARPGQSQRLPRAWDGQPPLVPHSLRGLVPITAKANACVRCHGRAGATSGPPPAPASHFIDGRDPSATPLKQVAGSRWNCTACHVPQTTAAPFAGPVFEAGQRRPPGPARR